MRKLLYAAGLALCGGLCACQLLFFLPELKDGKHYTQPTTADDISRGQQVAACLEEWAHYYFSQTAHFNDSLAHVSYADVDFAKLVIVGVGDPGVAGPNDFVGGRESGDTVFIPLRTLQKAPMQAIAIKRHELVHIVQQSHGELIGANADIHWAPPFNYCQIPRYMLT